MQPNKEVVMKIGDWVKRKTNPMGLTPFAWHPDSFGQVARILSESGFPVSSGLNINIKFYDIEMYEGDGGLDYLKTGINWYENEYHAITAEEAQELKRQWDKTHK